MVLLWVSLLVLPMCALANPARAIKTARQVSRVVAKTSYWQKIVRSQTWRLWECRIDRATPVAGVVIAIMAVFAIGKFGMDAIRKTRGKTVQRAGESKSSTVGVAVVAPEEVGRDEDMMIQVVGNVERALADSVSRAMALDEKNQAKLRGQCSFTCRLKDRIDFRLSIDGIRLDVDSQSVEWRQSDFSVQFLAHVPKDAAVGTHAGKLLVFVTGVPVGRIGFVTNVVRSKQQPCGTAMTTAINFKNYFVSYSSKDLDAVVGCLQGMRLTDKDISKHAFWDKMFLDPGARYEPVIYDYIDNKADVFLLFWSTNAATSEWVRKEYTRALERQERERSREVPLPEIVPIPLELPIPPPPAELADIHFGDPFIGFKKESIG